MSNQSELVEQLFESVLALSPTERGAFLDQQCHGDPELRRTLEELLAEDERAGSFLEHPAFKLPKPELTSPNEIGSPASVGRLKPNQILIDRFVLVRFIAKGGMGEVYEAADCLLRGAQVAVKTILPNIAANPDILQRFEQEVMLSRKVHHSNLCPIYDIFHCHQPLPSFLFLTMKLLTGETLAARLRRTTPIPVIEGLAIFKQMAAGLAAIHAAGIIHRDIKPNNIMLDGTGADARLYITDFGLARAYEAEPFISGEKLVAGSPVAGTPAAGTPDYMAPELFLGQRPSQASDLFAFGVVLHQVFTGVKPTVLPNCSSVAVSSRLNTLGVPSFCVQLIKGCLDLNPQRRCQAFERALQFR